MATTGFHSFDIGAFNQKDATAYNYAFKFFYPALCDFASRLVGDSNAADIVEDLFLKTWTGRQKFHDSEHLKAFLFHSIKNASLDLLKKNKRANHRDEAFTTAHYFQENDYLSNIIRAEVIIELNAAIELLPTEKGKIIKMTYLEGKTNQETADELGISIQTVKNQKLRGLALLRKFLPESTYMLLLSFPVHLFSK